MFERFEGGDRAVLVHLEITSEVTSVESQNDLDEFILLANSSGAVVLDIVKGKRQRPEKRYFVGTGKAEEVAQAVAVADAEVVLVNHPLTPSQERNLERLVKCRVLDRTGVILDIFAQRARSHDGKLQVELAQLRHMSTRLVRGWTHLERQKGGIGLRGPGEKQLETDRRLLAERMKYIHRRLEKVQQQRLQGRQGRSRAQIPTVSLVGYTNAGKSTLFNTLSGADVYAADQLFATLDPTMRRCDLSRHFAVVLADTVGFIRKLPHDLVASFRSTLIETVEADLLLHVVDAADPLRESNIEAVNVVLEEIGAGEQPQLLVFNKIDLHGSVARLDRDDEGKPSQVWVSAQTGEGMEFLRLAIEERLAHFNLHALIEVPVSSGRLRSALFARAEVLSEVFGEQGESLLEVNIERKVYQQLQHQHPEMRLKNDASLPEH